MKLTKQKLESLILETMGNRFTPEQEQKILVIIQKIHKQLQKIDQMQESYPPMVSDLYKYEDRIEAKLERLTKDPFWKPFILKHYNNLQTVANDFEEVNQYLVLLEDLEIDGMTAVFTKETLYDNLSGWEISKKFQQAVNFLEDIQNFDESFFAQDNVNLEALFDVSDSFYNNYSNLKDYLERVV